VVIISRIGTLYDRSEVGNWTLEVRGF